MRFSLTVTGLTFAFAAVAVGACGGSVQQDQSGASTGSGATGGASTTTGPAGTGGTTSTVSATSTTTAGPSTTASSTVASSSSTGPWMSEAQFPKPPQVQFTGGSVLTAPTIYGILFAGDDASTAASLADFTTKIGSTSYWTNAVSEYGVGPATAKIITLNETPASSLSDNQIQSWLVGKFGTDPNFPATPGANDLYIIYYPSGVTIDLFGMQSCQTFGGYHDETQVGNQPVAYAVVPRCSSFGMGSVLDVTTASASHELVEGVTDPYPMSNPAYPQPDDQDIFLIDALGGGEIGDMCAQQPQAFTTFPGFPYVVQRVWSNAQAAAGHDPCQPEPQGEVYYNAAPVFKGTVTYTIQGQPVPGVRGIKIPVGQSATVPVDFYSDGPMAAWPAKAYDYQSTFMGGSPLLSLTLTPPTGGNGTVGSLTIKVNQAGQGNEEIFFIASSTDNGQTVNWSFAVVTN